MKPDKLMTYLALIPHIKILKVGVAFSIPSEQTVRKEKESCEVLGVNRNRSRVALTELEEFENQGTSNYLEAVAARIGVPFLEKLVHHGDH